MTSATDIITYVGIPLAVLGVLPILYTSLLAILNARRIRRALLQHNHKPTATSKREQDGFTIRSSPMTTLIEVELPRYAITPFERGDERYWKLNGDKNDTHEQAHLLERADSTLSTIEEGKVQGYLRGGSWKAFQWKKLVVGKKLYRIQYVDELREPPAEVDFAEVIHLLLDWGVELDPMGWEKLRSGGLWTPAGTVLLRLSGRETIKGHGDWVLRTSMPDESDGILSLCVRWPGNHHDATITRGAASLPPGWGRLHQPIWQEASHESTDKKDLAMRIEELKSASKQAGHSTSMRFKSDGSNIFRVYWEYEDRETGTSSTVLFQSKFPQSQAWFTAIASSLLLARSYQNDTTSSSGMLWGFEIPSDLSAFSRKDTVPVGILVLLNILPEDEAPPWTSPTPTFSAMGTASDHQRRMEAQRAAERMEATMPPNQARIARQNREAAQRRETMDSMTRMNEARREHENRRVQDALVSVRINNKTLADTCLKFLIQNQEIPPGWNPHDVVETVLYLLVLDQSQSDNTTSNTNDSSSSQSHSIFKILEEWTSWSHAGGMKKEQFEMLVDWKVEFCLAACLVAVVQEAALTSQAKGMAKASVDMLECLNLWRKVRLG